MQYCLFFTSRYDSGNFEELQRKFIAMTGGKMVELSNKNSLSLFRSSVLLRFAQFIFFSLLDFQRLLSVICPPPRSHAPSAARWYRLSKSFEHQRFTKGVNFQCTKDRNVENKRLAKISPEELDNLRNSLFIFRLLFVARFFDFRDGLGSPRRLTLRRHVGAQSPRASTQKALSLSFA